MATRYDSERKRWTVEFEQAGVRVFRRLPQGATESQGKALEAKLRREIFDRETLQKVPALTLQDAIEQWLREDHRRKDRKKMASEAKQWAAFAKGKRLKDVPEIAQEAITEWVQCASPNSSVRTKTDATTKAVGSQKTQGTHTIFAAATINRRLAMLKAVCRHAYKQGRIGENLSGRITMLREDNKREVYLTRSQVGLLSKSAPTAATAAGIWLAAYTGLRASELLSVTHGNSRGGTLSVASTTSKTGKPRIVPIPAPAQKHLAGWLSGLSAGLDYWQLHKQFLVARKRAGMPTLHFHDLRHTCASWLINAKPPVDIYTLSKILGHSSTLTTARYAHLYHSTLKDAMGRLK
jgi:integrase